MTGWSGKGGRAGRQVTAVWDAAVRAKQRVAEKAEEADRRMAGEPRATARRRAAGQERSRAAGFQGRHNGNIGRAGKAGVG